jgi:AraC-like DNA-binding protein
LARASTTISTITRAQVFGLGGLPLALRRVHRHATTPAHRHEFSELVIVLRGTGIHQAPAGQYPIGAGDVFVLHGDQAHGYLDTEDLDLVNILFDLDALGVPRGDLTSLPGYHVLFTLEPRFRERDHFESRLRLDPAALHRVAGLVERIETEQESHRPGWQFAAVAHFMLTLVELSRCYSQVQGSAAESLQRLGRVIGHLEHSYRDTISLDDLARIGCMSRRTLTRVFRDAIGCSPLQYLIRLRINRAIEMLQDRRLRVKDAAFAAGFHDSNYFARQFCKVMGHSPTDARRRHRSG